MKYFIRAFQLYGVFSGRSTREEYWMFTLIYLVVYFCLSTIAFLLNSDVLSIILTILSFAVIVPTLSITARRLHDVGRSGWWQVAPLIGLVFAGIGAIQASSTLSLAGIALTFALAIVLLVFLIKPSDDDNQYGKKPQP